MLQNRYRQTRSYGVKTGGVYYPRSSSKFNTKVAQYRANRARYGYSTVPRTRGAYSKGEMKYFDTNRSLVAVAASPTWTSVSVNPATINTLFCPTVGSAINQRIGREVKVSKIKIRGCFEVAPQQNQLIGDYPSVIRLVLVQDTQTNATQMTGTQLMSSGSTTLDGVNAFQNLDNFGRFRVLKDKHITLQNPNTAYDGTNLEQQGLIRYFKITHVFKKPISVRFNATNGGDIADIVDHSFHLLSNASSTSLDPKITYNCRVCYKE